MSDRSSATDRSYRQESTDGSYFAPLAQARYLLLTTFRQKGAPVSVRVQGIIDGDRAYVRTWSRSGTVKRLRHANGVQVTPCDVLGLCSYGPPLDAAARLLADEEASRIAGQLARKYPFGAVSWPGCSIGRGTGNWCITSFWPHDAPARRRDAECACAPRQVRRALSGHIQGRCQLAIHWAARPPQEPETRVGP